MFTGGDIVKELPQVAKNFSNVDRSWVKIMNNAESDPNVIKLCCGDEMLQELLPHLKESLEKCQRSLSSYLEAKRMVCQQTGSPNHQMGDMLCKAMVWTD